MLASSISMAHPLAPSRSRGLDLARPERSGLCFGAPSLAPALTRLDLRLADQVPVLELLGQRPVGTLDDLVPVLQTLEDLELGVAGDAGADAAQVHAVVGVEHEDDLDQVIAL